MIGRRLMDGLRRTAALLALLAVTLFVLQAAPSHAEPPAGGDAGAVSAHHAGDGDPGAAHHGPGAHCATHCAVHLAPPVLAMTEVDASLEAAARPRPTDDAVRATLRSAPPIRPPAA